MEPLLRVFCAAAGAEVWPDSLAFIGGVSTPEGEPFKDPLDLEDRREFGNEMASLSWLPPPDVISSLSPPISRERVVFSHQSIAR